MKPQYWLALSQVGIWGAGIELGRGKSIAIVFICFGVGMVAMVVNNMAFWWDRPTKQQKILR